MTDEIVIKAEGLTKKFGSFTATDHVTFEVRKGEIFGFLGANGAGKTTAMRMLCGLSQPSEGKATVAGYDVATEYEQVKRHIGYMSQKFSLYDDLTVEENLVLFGGIYGMPRNKVRDKIAELLQELGFEAERKTMVKSLPLGWKQKLAFSVLRIMSCILRSAGHLVQRDERGEQCSVGAFHILYKDGMSFAEHFDLVG